MVVPATSAGAQVSATTRPTAGASTPWRASSAEPPEGGGHAMRRRPMEEVGDVVWDGVRRLRDAPTDEERRDGPRADGREGESKRTRRRTSPLLGRRRGEAAEAAAGGDGGGGVLTVMVVLCV